MQVSNKKTMIIHAPEGYEIGESQSTLREIVFKPIKKKLAYEDIAKKIFEDDTVWYIDDRGAIEPACISSMDIDITDATNCTSEKQAQKLLAINKLMNVAKYLNGNWKPNWDSLSEGKFYLKTENNGKIEVNCVYSVISGDIYFKTEELVTQAVEILGEDTIKLALSTDW